MKEHKSIKKIIIYILIAICAALILVVLVGILFLNRLDRIEQVRSHLHIQFTSLIIEARTHDELELYSGSLSQEAFTKLQEFDISGSVIASIIEEDSYIGYTVTFVDGRHFLVRVDDDYEINGWSYVLFLSTLSNFDNVSDNYLLEHSKIVWIYDMYSPD